MTSSSSCSKLLLWWKRPVVRLAALYGGCFFALGLALASLGPALLELKEQTDSTLFAMGLVFTARSVGYLIGSVIGGPLFDKMDGNRLLGVGMLCTGAGMALIPFVPHVALLGVLVLTQGCSMGLLDTGGNVMLLWSFHGEEDAAEPYMQALHFAFALGAFVSPLLIGSLMHARNDDIVLSFELIAAAFVPLAVAIFCTPSPKAPVKPATPASASRASSTEPEKDEETLLGDDVASSDAPEAEPDDVAVAVDGACSTVCRRWLSFHYRGAEARIVLLTALFLFFYVGAEVSAGGYLYSYAVKEDLASKRHAAFINAAFWGALALGRLIAVPAAIRWTSEQLMTFNVSGCLVSSVVLVLSLGSVEALWVGVLLYGFFMASLFPTAIVLAEHYLGSVSGRAASFFVAGASLGEMALPLLCAGLFATIGIHSFLVALSAFAVVATVVYFQLRGVGRAHRKQLETSVTVELSSEA